MRHIDLFSGIGGFALAASAVWGGEYKNACFCEIDKFCQEVLKKNFGKESLIYGDIAELITDAEGERFREKGTGFGRPSSWTSRCDLLTGGFPCQPFSCAGKRKGTSDDRHLWPKMLRVIQLTKPTWVVAENVRGLLTIEQGVVFEQVCADLEGEGYEVQPFIIPAVAVNAPHRRDRLWIIANINKERFQEQRPREQTSGAGQPDEIASHTQGFRHGGSTSKECGVPERVMVEDEQGRSEARYKSQGCDWNRPWFEVATQICGVDDGLSTRLDGFELSKARHRVERLKSLGNSIVPQVAIEIFKAIKSIERR